uniref:VpsR-related response regulator n=1 Tax=Dyella sp. ASV21 TaxID=2795114 RepID=UPI001E3ECBC4
MAVLREEARRCVVWFGQPDDTERAELAKAGWIVRVADAGAQAGVGMRNNDTVVALADLRLGDPASPLIMAQLMEDHPWLPWVALVSPDMPAQDPLIDRILEASIEYVTAPVDLERLIETLARIGGDRPAEPPEPGDIGVTGHSMAIRNVVASIRKYAPVELPVLITGETGTGKEVAARALHGLSARADRP